MKYLAFPYDVARQGRTATADIDAHVKQLIEQLLYTAPGERVMRPTFGTGVMQLVFAPVGPGIQAVVEATLRANLLQFLGERILLEGTSVELDDDTVQVTVAYRRRVDQHRTVQSFTWVIER